MELFIPPNIDSGLIEEIVCKGNCLINIHWYEI